MANTRYRRGGAYAADMAVYARAMAADNSAQLSRVKRNLVRALREDVTPRQREVLVLRYWSGLSEAEIADACGISRGAVKSTASRALVALEKSMARAASAPAGTSGKEER